MDTSYHSLKERHAFFAWALFLVFSIITGLLVVEWTENRRFLDNQRRSIVEQLSTIRARLEGELNAELLLARSIITEVATNTDITEERFFKIAQHFMEASNHIRNIGLAKGTVLTYVYPIKGNEKAIGLDYTKVASQWQAVKRVIEERQTVVAGPLNLLQGGIGIIGRTPIYIGTDSKGSEQVEYFGLLSVVINLPSLFEAAGLDNKDALLKISIRGKDGLGAKGEIFYGPEDLFADDPVLMEVTLPGGNWLMASAPVTGWETNSPRITYYRIVAMAVGLVILISLFIQRREMNSRKKAEEERKGLIRELQKAFSEVKRSEEAIKRSDSLQNKMVANIGDVIVIIDQGGINRYKSPNIEKLFGWKPEEVVGSSTWDNVHPDDLESTQKYLGALMHEVNATGTIECRYKCKDGSYKWIEFTGSNLLYDPDIRGFLGNYHDITDRKKAEQSLRESETRFKALHNASFGGIAIHDKGIILECNQGLSEMTGYSLTELIGMDGLLLIAEKSRNAVMKNIVGGYEKPYEVIGLRKNGEEFPIRIEARNVPYKGKIVRTVEFRDITERKLAEEALKKERDRSQKYLDVAGVMFLALDTEQNVTMINKKGCEILGYEEHEIVGKNWFDHFIKAENTEEIKEVFNKIISGNIKPVEYYENSVLTKDGSEKIIAWHNSVAKDESGHIISLLSSGEDISKRKHIEHERDMLEDQIFQAQKMESIGTLAGGIAHDFNNILYPIIGYTELSMGDVPKDSRTYEHLAEILKAAMRAGDLVKQILTFGRKGDQENKPVMVHIVVKEALKLLRSSIPKTIEIRQKIDKDCGLVMGDSTQVHQIVMNLCTNAYHAMDDTGGELEVTLTEIDLLSDKIDLNPGKYLLLSVNDTGHGMQPDTVSRIFDPYYTTKESDKGTGLGLSVTHGIVKNHRGSISVVSEPGIGTTFHVYLPVIEKEEMLVETESNQIILTGNEHVLLVDDEDAIVNMEQQMLERIGYKVTSRTSSVEALEVFRAHPDDFDLVITDMTMPNMTGLQLAQKIKKIKAAIPIIICTGFSEQLTGENFQALGIQGYVMKPVIIKDLAQTIRIVLDAPEES